MGVATWTHVLGLSPTTAYTALGAALPSNLAPRRRSTSVPFDDDLANISGSIPRDKRRGSGENGRILLQKAQKDILDAVDSRLNEEQKREERQVSRENTAGLALALTGLASNYVLCYPFSVARRQYRAWPLSATDQPHILITMHRLTRPDTFSSAYRGCFTGLLAKETTMIVEYSLRLLEHRVQLLHTLFKKVVPQSVNSDYLRRSFVMAFHK
ncbi:hypothetical protein HK097_004120, partial [Rhizophlyctis rosea]